MLAGRDSAIFLFLQYFSIAHSQELSVVQVDLSTGHSDELFHVVLDTSPGYYHSPVLCGDLLAVGLLCRPRNSTGKRLILVLDWRKGAYVIFDCSTHSPSTQVVFVPGHIILAGATSGPQSDQLILVYTLHAIASRWRPITELVYNTDPSTRAFDDFRIVPSGISPAVVERLEHNNRVFRYPLRLHMTLHPNPIRDRTYKLTLYAADTATSTESKTSVTETFRQRFGRASRRAKGAMLFTYQIIVGSPTECGLSWTRTSVFSTNPNLVMPLSYAGYAMIYSDDSSGDTIIVDARLIRRRFPWVRQRIREVVVACRGFNHASLSSTGAVLVLKNAQIEISYHV